MVPTKLQAQIIQKFGLRGTVLEQLVMQPGALTDPERYVDSPSLMRFAMDVSRALAAESDLIDRTGHAVQRRRA